MMFERNSNEVLITNEINIEYFVNIPRVLEWSCPDLESHDMKSWLYFKLMAKFSTLIYRGQDFIHSPCILEVAFLRLLYNSSELDLIWKGEVKNYTWSHWDYLVEVRYGFKYLTEPLAISLWANSLLKSELKIIFTMARPSVRNLLSRHRNSFFKTLNL